MEIKIVNKYKLNMAVYADDERTRPINEQDGLS